MNGSLAKFILLPLALVALGVGADSDSMILSSRVFRPTDTTATFLDRFKTAQEDLLILVSIHGLEDAPALNPDLGVKLNLSQSRSVSDNCTLINEQLLDLDKSITIKVAKSVDTLDIAKEGLWIYEAPFNETAIQKIAEVARDVSINKHVVVIVTKCPIDYSTRVGSGSRRKGGAGGHDAKDEIRVTPLVFQQVSLMIVFFLILMVGLSWSLDIKLPASLLRPNLNAKRAY